MKRGPYKKYIVFVIAEYYPSGGVSDIEDDSDSLAEARELAKKHAGTESWEIVDRDTWEVVDHG